MRRHLATVVLALALASGGLAHAATPVGEAQAPVAVGAFIHNSYLEPELYDRWARIAGRRPVVLGSYKTWTIPAIDPEQLDEIWSRGAVPMVTWEPWGGAGQVFSLADIAAGRYDEYVRNAALAAAAWGRPLFIRFAHEMNGYWYPWGDGVNGNTPAEYREAWRRIVGIFRANGADNAIWVWGPNQNFSGRFPFRQFYPGDEWVDWIGIDGFNWARSPRWQSFTEIFASSYNAVVELTEKPIMIAETGSWEHGGSKAAWVADTLERELPLFAHVRALVWWSVEDSRGDLRIESSPSALRALRVGLASPHYGADREELLATPERLPGEARVGLAGRGSVAREVRHELQSNYLWLGLAAMAGCLLVIAAAIAWGRRQRPATSPSRDAPS